MKELEILGANRFDTWTEHRVACRGIVIREEQILLSYEAKTDLYMLPGGGAEGEETQEECCRREIAEETGILVDVGDHFLTMKEYYEEWCFETHFFVCVPAGETVRNLTVREQEVCMVPQWVSQEKALAIFSRHQEYASTNEEKRGIYLREYLALKEFSY